MSTPSSRALVVASARNRPSRIADSSARRSSGRYPPRYAATCVASPGSTARRFSWATVATVSAARRERVKASVRAPATVRSVRRSATSAVAERRGAAASTTSSRSSSGAGTAHGSSVGSGRTRGSSGGCQRANVLRPAGEPSSVTATTSSGSTPRSRAALIAGSAVVAEASRNVGCAPYDQARRWSRRSTAATCAPNTPRNAWLSSMTTYLSPRRSRTHRRWFGSSPTCR
ncbi:hypothetical protein GALL_456780 [mine drainage metagenome]|uniref:Uncharacterized protein n=1 Tax=mine drainage metagenome TaxID=410659 RepID=A0A1J5Q9N4_9ZZZZ